MSAIVAPGEPGRAAARLPAVVLGPGLAAGLSGRGNGVGLPFQCAGLHVVRLEVAANAIFAARDADDDVILHDEGRGIRCHAAFPVVDRNVPDDLSVGAIERDQPRVEPGDDHEIAGERHAAMDRPAAQHGVEPIAIFGLVAPKDVAGLGVDGEGARIIGGEVEDAVAEERRRFEAAELPAGRHRPDRRELRGVFRGDLGQAGYSASCDSRARKSAIPCHCPAP